MARPPEPPEPSAPYDDGMTLDAPEALRDEPPPPRKTDPHGASQGFAGELSDEMSRLRREIEALKESMGAQATARPRVPAKKKATTKKRARKRNA